jgi:hypothetical protein
VHGVVTVPGRRWSAASGIGLRSPVVRPGIEPSTQSGRRSKDREQHSSSPHGNSSPQLERAVSRMRRHRRLPGLGEGETVGRLQGAIRRSGRPDPGNAYGRDAPSRTITAPRPRCERPFQAQATLGSDPQTRARTGTQASARRPGRAPVFVQGGRASPQERRDRLAPDCSTAVHRSVVPPSSLAGPFP